MGLFNKKNRLTDKTKKYEPKHYNRFDWIKGNALFGFVSIASILILYVFYRIVQYLFY